jgi:hypothetical protein
MVAAQILNMLGIIEKPSAIHSSDVYSGSYLGFLIRPLGTPSLHGSHTSSSSSYVTVIYFRGSQLHDPNVSVHSFLSLFHSLI